MDSDLQIEQGFLPHRLRDRAEMERARLARRKRNFPPGSPAPRSQTPGAGSSATTRNRPDKRLKQSSQPSASQDVEPEFFWEGEMRPTTTPLSSETPAFHLQQIIGETADLKMAILTGMVVDHPWLLSQNILPAGLPTIVVTNPRRTGPAGSLEVEASVAFLSSSWVRCCPAMEGGPGIMHTKLMLFFYRTNRLRVVITTADLVEPDWSVVENMAWIQDLPLVSKGPELPLPSPLGTKFQRYLAVALAKLNVAAGLISLRNELPPSYTTLDNLLAGYDFSAIRVAIVVSIPGVHVGWPNVLTVGHTGLMDAVKDLGAICPPGNRLSVEYQGSSIGYYTSQWIQQFLMSAEGGAGHHALLKQSPSKRQQLPFPTADRLNILFPSSRTIDRCIGGRSSASMIFCDDRLWSDPCFPRHLFRDAKSKTGRVLMHSKMIIATFHKEQTPGSPNRNGSKHTTEYNPQIGGWGYMGSHDFSASAWGDWTPTSTWFTPVLHIKNFELGIVFPLTENGTQRAANDAACFTRPALEYGPQEIPWMQRLPDSPFGY